MTADAPRTIDALATLVASTASAGLRIGGAGTKRRAAAADSAATIDARGLTGFAAYDPAECVVTVGAGTPVADVAQLLATHGQYLPWDPPFVDDGATIGGMIASGLNGPGRLRYGGVRDFVIGATVVDGRGRRIASGGQVVKNAAGFLLHHALVGSGGRLGVIAEVSLKVFPHAEATCTVVTRAGSTHDALAAHERLRRAALDLDALDLDVSTHTVLARLAGAAAALPARAERAAHALGGDVQRLHGHDEAAQWAAHTRALWHSGPLVVKVPTTPGRLGALLEALAPLGAVRASVAGAVVYLTTAAPLDAVDTALAGYGTSGAVVRGVGHGRRLGPTTPRPFHDRVRATLDPDGRFC